MTISHWQFGDWYCRKSTDLYHSPSYYTWDNFKNNDITHIPFSFQSLGPLGYDGQRLGQFFESARQPSIYRPYFRALTADLLAHPQVTVYGLTAWAPWGSKLSFQLFYASPPPSYDNTYLTVGSTYSEPAYWNGSLGAASGTISGPFPENSWSKTVSLINTTMMTQEYTWLQAKSTVENIDPGGGLDYAGFIMLYYTVPSGLTITPCNGLASSRNGMRGSGQRSGIQG
jgi:hypothetical protein